MAAFTDRLDRGFGRADQLADRAIRQFGVELDQPVDRGRAVLTLGQGGVTRAATLFLTHRRSVELELHAVQGISLRAVNLNRVKLVVGKGVKALDATGHVPVGDALHLKLMQAAEIGDLGEAEGRVVHQPDSGGLGHERL